MTNERAREVATNILSLTLGRSRPLDMTSHAEALIVAYRAEVRREVLKEARKQYVPVPDCDNYESRAAAIDAAYEQRRLFRAMLDRMIARTGAPETAAPINTSGDTVVIESGTVIARYPIGCLHPFHCAKYAPPYCAGLDNACPHARPPVPPPSRDADLDTVWRTLAQAYVGNDYTIEGRKFQGAVGRLWGR